MTIHAASVPPSSSRPSWMPRPGRSLVYSLALAGLIGLAGCGSDDDPPPAPPEPPANTYPHAKEPIGTVRQMYDGTLTPDLAVNTFRNIDRLFPTRSIAPAATPRPLPKAAKQLPAIKFTAGGKNYDIYDYLALNRVSGLLVLKNGEIAYETYQYGNTEKTRWMSMSVAKSITSTLIGVAIQDGLIGSVHDQVVKYVPKLAGSAYDGATVRDVLMMSSGVKWDETYTNPASDRRALLEAQIGQKPGTALELMSKLPRAAAPGSTFNYSTGETQIAGELLHGAIKKPLAHYLSEKIWSKFGMEAEANWWLDSPDGIEIGGSGLSATLRDWGRFGLFFMNDGVIDGKSILPNNWVADAGSGKSLSGGDPLPYYGYMWWVNTDGQSAIDKAFYATGIFGQNIYINQKEKVVIVTWGAQSKPTGAGVVNNTAFFDAVVKALQ
ncbi:serine hydrolase domain-containing protein [Pigmentiphaga kullae]|uniref:serine hydrolase domain-containing protein n=1 Tax=Pigmentiphaga kullae TaxID=151784 RepID=UPI001F5E75E2|nr:serine hydrolase [Pigmentiphaga kullae]